MVQYRGGRSRSEHGSLIIERTYCRLIKSGWVCVWGGGGGGGIHVQQHLLLGRVYYSNNKSLKKCKPEYKLLLLPLLFRNGQKL